MYYKKSSDAKCILYVLYYGAVTVPDLQLRAPPEVPQKW